MNKWKPIDGAPRGGVPIIGRSRYKEVFDCVYLSAESLAKFEGGSADEYSSGWYRAADISDEVCPVEFIDMPVTSEEAA